jgi:hypothetical protein
VLIWIAALLLMFATRDRGPVADTAGVPGAPLAEPVAAES